MKHLEKIWWVGVSVAILGIVGFWSFGLNDNMKAVEYSLIVACISSFIALTALTIQKLRNSNQYY
ncbi:MAG: hypothetical protein PHE89_04505 [Alphaproteobacteria bacterium]|nr:hypothetical protein [Alphaproteobacteria bacterium]